MSNCVNDRVSGGDEACEGQYPWLGFLELRHKTTSEKNQCGASLISLRHLITAGHCVFQHDVEKARLGAYDLNNHNPYEQEFVVTKVTLHIDYKHGLAPHNDLAILELDRNVQLTDWI